MMLVVSRSATMRSRSSTAACGVSELLVEQARVPERVVEEGPERIGPPVGDAQVRVARGRRRRPASPRARRTGTPRAGAARSSPRSRCERAQARRAPGLGPRCVGVRRRGAGPRRAPRRASGSGAAPAPCRASRGRRRRASMRSRCRAVRRLGRVLARRVARHRVEPATRLVEASRALEHLGAAPARLVRGRARAAPWPRPGRTRRRASASRPALSAAAARGEARRRRRARATGAQAIARARRRRARRESAARLIGALLRGRAARISAAATTSARDTSRCVTARSRCGPVGVDAQAELRRAARDARRPARRRRC